MRKNKLKEKIILFGGTIGIGAISLAITLMVYNVQLNNEQKVNYKNDAEIVYNTDLTESQKIVVDNLIAELNKLEEKEGKENNVNKILNNTTSEKEINIEINDVTDETEKIETSIYMSNDTKGIENKNPMNINNDLIIQEDKNENKNNELTNQENKNDVIETIAKVDKKISFIKPVEGDIGMSFSDNKLVYSKTLNEWLVHKGIDILTDKGTDVKMSEDGIIKDIYEDTRYGFTIVVEHDEGYLTKYSGVKNNETLKIGMKLKQGDIISQVSEACGFEIGEGSHLHFEILKDGVNVNPEFEQRN